MKWYEIYTAFYMGQRDDVEDTYLSPINLNISKEIHRDILFSEINHNKNKIIHIQDNWYKIFSKLDRDDYDKNLNSVGDTYLYFYMKKNKIEMAIQLEKEQYCLITSFCYYNDIELLTSAYNTIIEDSELSVRIPQSSFDITHTDFLANINCNLFGVYDLYNHNNSFRHTEYYDLLKLYLDKNKNENFQYIIGFNYSSIDTIQMLKTRIFKENSGYNYEYVIHMKKI